MTTAAMMSMTVSPPSVVWAEATRPQDTSAVTAMVTPSSAETRMRVFATLMPETRAASGLPPMAMTSRPNWVRLKMTAPTAIKHTIRMTGKGMGPR